MSSKTELLYANLRFWLFYLDKGLTIDGEATRSLLRNDVIALLDMLGNMRVNETLDELEKLLDASRDKAMKPPSQHVIDEAFIKARRATEDEVARQEEKYVKKNADAIKRRLNEIATEGATGAIGATRDTNFVKQRPGGVGQATLGATGRPGFVSSPTEYLPNDPRRSMSGECQEGGFIRDGQFGKTVQSDNIDNRGGDNIPARHTGVGWEHFIGGRWVKGRRPEQPREQDPQTKTENTNPNAVWICPVLKKKCVDECSDVNNCAYDKAMAQI